MTLNDGLLTTSEVQTLRMALTSFIEKMRDPNALGENDQGREMVKAYREQAIKLLRKIHE